MKQAGSWGVAGRGAEVCCSTVADDHGCDLLGVDYVICLGLRCWGSWGQTDQAHTAWSTGQLVC